jgi:hypothetical protein
VVLLAGEPGKALVVLRAGRAVAQVFCYRRKEPVDVEAGELALHVLGEEREGSFAAGICSGGPEQARDQIAFAHCVPSWSR